MNWNKLQLKLQVLFTPSLWLRNHNINWEYDKWLWDKMDEGCKIEPWQFSLLANSVSKHSVKFAGKEIWIDNAPYSDGKCDPVRFDGVFNPSRATALRFRKLYNEYQLNKASEEKFE